MSRNYTRKKARKVLNLSEEDHAKAVELAKTTKLDMGIVTGYLYDLALKYDLFSVGWEDRMKANLTSVEGLEYLTAENKCESLSWDDTNWLCVKLRKDKAPKVTKLGKTIQLMNGRCTPCKAQTWAKEDEAFKARLERHASYRRGWKDLPRDWVDRIEELKSRGSPEDMEKQVDIEMMSWRVKIQRQFVVEDAKGILKPFSI